MFGWSPAEFFSPTVGLMFICAAAAGPALQMLAPDQGVLEEVQDLFQDLEDAEEQINKSNSAAEAAEKQAAETEASTQSAKAETAAANTRASVSERVAAEAEAARMSAETEMSKAVAKTETLLTRTEDAEGKASKLQVRVNCFEARNLSDRAVEEASVAEENIAVAKRQMTFLQDQLRSVQEECQRTQTEYDAVVSVSGSVWDAVEVAAHTAIAAETDLADSKAQADAAVAAVNESVISREGAEEFSQKTEVAAGKYKESLAALSCRKQEARDTDVRAGFLSSEVQVAGSKVSATTAELETAKEEVQVATVDLQAAKKIAAAREIEAVAAEWQYAALISTEKQNAELTTQIAVERSEKDSALAQVGELKDAVKNALRASGCTLSLVRVAIEEEVAYYKADLALPQSYEITFAIRIEDDEGEEVVFRTIPPGGNSSEAFEVDRGYNAKIRILNSLETLQAFGTEAEFGDIATYLVA